MTNTTEETIEKIACPVCQDKEFYRDFLLDHLQIYHSPAEVYVALEET